MRNFVIQFKFGEKVAKQQFRDKVESAFDQIKKHSTDEYTYYLVTEYSVASVEDILDMFVDNLRIDGYMSEYDYVAVYYTTPAEPDQIKRTMVYGKDDYIDNDLKKSYMPQHNAVIDDLLNFDFARNQV